MYYNSHAKKARDKFANNVIEVVCPTDYRWELSETYRKQFAIPVFLAGGVIPDNDWRKEVVKYFQENWKEEKGIIFFNPVREDFNLNDPDDVKKQIEWEFQYLNHHDMFVSFYFPPTQFPQAMSFYELGRALAKREQDAFGNWIGQDVYVCIHKDYKRKTDLIVQGTLANYGNLPCEVDSVEQFAAFLMHYIRMNYNTNIPLESKPDRCCGCCKNFRVYPIHGSHQIGHCYKKANMVEKGFKTGYFDRVVEEDGLCELFEKNED